MHFFASQDGLMTTLACMWSRQCVSLEVQKMEVLSRHRKAFPKIPPISWGMGHIPHLGHECQKEQSSWLLLMMSTVSSQPRKTIFLLPITWVGPISRVYLFTQPKSSVHVQVHPPTISIPILLITRFFIWVSTFYILKYPHTTS